MRIRTAVLTTMLTLGGTVGCGESPGTSSRDVAVDTVGGVETVTSRAPERVELSWRVGEPRLVIGAVDGDGPDVFGSIGGIVVDRAGRIFVGDAQAKEIRVFGADGTYAFAFGREGEGPGEFENIDAMRLTPDGELLVRDVDQGRVSVFGLDGQFRRQFRLERLFFQYQTRPTLWVDTLGNVYDWLMLTAGAVDSMGVAVYDSIGALANRIVTDVYDRPMIRLLRGDTPIAGMPIPMTPFAVAAVDRRGRIISGVGDAYELEVRDAGGRLRRRIRREITPEPVPGWLADTVRARIASFREDMGGGNAEDFDLPETRPAFTLLLVDDLDYLWIARDGDQRKLPTEFDVFDPEDRYLGSLTLPPMRLMQIGRDFLAGITYDDLGVERAVILPLERG